MRGRTALFSSKWSRGPSGRGNRVYGEEERIGAASKAFADGGDGAGIRVYRERLKGQPQEVQHSAAGSVGTGTDCPRRGILPTGSGVDVQRGIKEIPLLYKENGTNIAKLLNVNGYLNSFVVGRVGAPGRQIQ